MGKKIRLDVLLVERGLIETREKAKRTIMAGLVFEGQTRLDKPGVKVEETIDIKIKGRPIPYVSRGGLKLEKALKEFSIDLKGKKMVDIGSSTGGFTDCALQNGVSLSYAIDVGYNQLDWKLRNHDQVVVMERTNFRYVTADDLVHGKPEFASIDVSFISLKLILPVLANLLKEGSDIVALIKPQFEAGRELVGKKGIVREAKVHRQVVEEILSFSMEKGYCVHGLTYSPITGGDGNIEFLVHLHYPGTGEEGKMLPQVNTREVIEEAHASLKK
ncbi:TlyA family RNA methyltransferase [Halobacillus massiliensis]|uniref:TlyA family RNA methyltransferase n=1 Tax=Halobacillus massiliensis TaxID=1926286 RepID=UPI0009E59137|nr:TlyA family RNA methyltransferase [Halobacillus massiliensis]